MLTFSRAKVTERTLNCDVNPSNSQRFKMFSSRRAMPLLLVFSSNLFFMKTSKDFSDGHLWYSVISRPPSSTFTCVQRVSCCFSLLLCTMLTSIMFYGIPADPSEQTMDLGTTHFHSSDHVNLLVVCYAPVFQANNHYVTSSYVRSPNTAFQDEVFVSISTTSLCFQVTLSSPGNSS